MKLYILVIFLFFCSCNNYKSDNQKLTQIVGSDRILAFVYSDNGKSGLMDTNKNIILPAQFDHIENWQVDNLIRIDSGGEKIRDSDVVGYNFKKYGLINTQGQILFRPKFDDLRVSNNSALVRVDSLFGFIDNKGNWLIRPKYKVAYPFYKGTAVVQEKNQFRLINKQGQKIIGQTFDTIWSFKNDIAVIEKDKKRGFINYKGTYILPMDNYQGIGEYNWYFGEFQKDGKWFLIDTAGHIPIKEGFDEVQIRGNEDSVFAVGKQNGKPVKIRLK
jgi:WG containing repeat